eukprot:235577_1
MQLLFNSILALYFLYIRFFSCSFHDCTTINNEAECSGKTINCSIGEDCNVSCNGQNACRNTIINCDNSNYVCNINCNDGWSCSNMRINSKNSLSLTITTSTTGTNQLENATVICPNTGTCFINCADNYKMCENIKINAETSTLLNLKCTGTSTTCQNIKLYCPLNGYNSSCIIECIPNTGSTTISKIDIYSKYGFNGVHIIGDKPFPNSIGNIHCLSDYISTCLIDEINNNICTISEIDKTCDEPNIPTNIPTSDPTTNNPTNVPTTNTPTNVPTTNNPTNVPTITVHPTNAPIIERSVYYDYEIIIHIDLTDLNTDEINIIVLNTLNITSNYDMTIMSGKKIILLISVPFHLDTDTIEKRVTETLTMEYPDKDIIVKVKATDDTTKRNNNDKNNKSVYIYILIIVITVILMVIILLVIIYFYRKNNKYSSTDVNILELSPES